MGLEVNEFVAELEELFGMTIPGEEMVRITTPRQLAGFIHERLTNRERTPMSAIDVERQVYRVLIIHAPKADFTLETHFREIFY
jgi:hypothetical protein